MTAAKPVNILLSSFPGLSLPPTLSFSLSPTSTIADLTTQIASYLPPTLPLETLTLTTTSNRTVTAAETPIQALLYPPQDASTTTAKETTTLLCLRLTAAILGGKGGFGSQLRAAGGRMSSKRKRNQNEDNASSRNLDGRRLRTVNEAKALAEYLAVKPEMERKEKEERRRRWQAVVDAAEKRQEEMKNGSSVGRKLKVDNAWMEDREEVGERTRDAVLAIMKEGIWTDNLKEIGSGNSSATLTDEEEEENARDPLGTTRARKFVGFDDDDEFMSDSDEDMYKGKGKAKA